MSISRAQREEDLRVLRVLRAKLSCETSVPSPAYIVKAMAGSSLRSDVRKKKNISINEFTERVPD